MGSVLWVRAKSLGWTVRPFALLLGRQPPRASKKSLTPSWASVSSLYISVAASVLKSKNWIDAVSDVHTPVAKKDTVRMLLTGMLAIQSSGWWGKGRWEVIRIQWGPEGGDFWEGTGVLLRRRGLNSFATWRHREGERLCAWKLVMPPSPWAEPEPGIITASRAVRTKWCCLSH